MIIRPVMQDDLASLAAMHLASWRAAYRGIMPDSLLASLSQEEFEENWRQTMSNSLRRSFLCEANAELLGLVSFSIGPSDLPPAEAVGEIFELYVAPSCWGQGYGSSLCNLAVTQSFTAGCAAVELWVLTANSPARRFYEAQGFQLEAGRTLTVNRHGAELHHVRYARRRPEPREEG